MTLAATLPILAWALSAGAFAYYTVMVAREITYVTLADGRKTERRLPLVFRLLLPFANNFRASVSSPRFAPGREKFERRLIAAGMEGVLSGGEFLALQFLLAMAFGALAIAGMVVATQLIGEAPFVGNIFFIVLSSVVMGFMYPQLWLNRALKSRHLAIMKALPFVLDLLTLSVEAGMDFMSALNRNCHRRAPDALNEELLRMLHEIQLGTPRRVALKNLAVRTGQSDLTAVVHALVQADELGVSLGPVLRIQSDELRSRRFERAEKLANEAPVKMLGPLLLCIFPAVFVILLGPVLHQAAESIF